MNVHSFCNRSESLGSCLGLYDYCALVPILHGAGGAICDWDGRELTLENHERSKGRVVACANDALLAESLKILQCEGPVLQSETGENKEENLLSLLPNQSNAAPLLLGVMVGEVIAHIGL